MTRLLVVNPNSSKSITAAIEASLAPHAPPGVDVTYFTPSTGPAGISDAKTAAESTEACMAELVGGDGAPASHPVEQYDGVLVSCFSEHPLIERLTTHFAAVGSKAIAMGIFQAGIASSLLLSPGPFGILATGSVRREPHYVGVANFVGSDASKRFAGSFVTGLGVVELQEGDQAKVERNMKETAARIIDAGARVLLFGCAGMCGMDAWLHEAAASKGVSVTVVDGAKCGLHLLAGLARTR